MRNEDLEKKLSAYLDQELPQMERQQMRIYLEDVPEARERFEELKRVKEMTSSLQFPEPPDRRLDELGERLSIQAPRKAGWLFFLLGAIAMALFFIFAVLRAPDIPVVVKALMGAITLGLSLLFWSVARQRYLEAPHDRYRGVKR